MLAPDPVQAFVRAVLCSDSVLRHTERAPDPGEPAYAEWEVVVEAVLADARAAWKQGVRGDDLHTFVAGQVTERWRLNFCPNASPDHIARVRDECWLPAVRALVKAQERVKRRP